MRRDSEAIVRGEMRQALGEVQERPGRSSQAVTVGLGAQAEGICKFFLMKVFVCWEDSLELSDALKK